MPSVSAILHGCAPWLTCLKKSEIENTSYKIILWYKILVNAFKITFDQNHHPSFNIQHILDDTNIKRYNVICTFKITILVCVTLLSTLTSLISTSIDLTPQYIFTMFLTCP